MYHDEHGNIIDFSSKSDSEKDSYKCELKESNYLYNEIKENVIKRWMTNKIRMFEIVFLSLVAVTRKNQSDLFRDIFFWNNRMGKSQISKTIQQTGCTTLNCIRNENIYNILLSGLNDMTHLKESSEYAIRITNALYTILFYNKSKFNEDFLKKMKRYRVTLDLFYCEALTCAIENDSLELILPPPSYRIDDNNEKITYHTLITIISETLNVSKYQAVTLTIPDNELFWADDRNDSKLHFLKPYEDRINNSVDLFLELQSIAENCQVLKTYLESSRLKKSVGQIYTFNYQEYVEKQFRKMQSRFTRQDSADKEIYKRLHGLIEKIIKEMQKYSDMLSKIQEVEDYLSKCIHYDDITGGTNLKSYIRQLSIICYKLSAFVLLEESGEKPSFSLIPVKTERYLELDGIATKIKNTTDKKEKLDKYVSLWCDSIEHLNLSTVEINLLCEKLYVDFFRLVNNIEVQDKYIFSDGDLCKSVLGLYEEMYKHIKYRLYRGYSFEKIDADNITIMRNSLIDRKIVLDYLKCGLENTFEFDYTKADNTSGKFVIRLATKGDDSDFNIIQKLNNPSKPYRRAIYVKSDDEEITKAIADRSVWIVEEINGDERYVACVAVILRYSYTKSNDEEINADSGNTGKAKRENAIFNTDELNKKQEKDYYKKVKRDFKYLDFDSILTNDGCSGVSERSYRGYGFMRLLLVLAEELAKKEGCDYICATVSSFNAPSKRNFMLNGYNVVDSVAYRLKENQRSEFDVYIKDEKRSSVEQRITNTTELADEIRKYGDALDKLHIDAERYREDADVPRDYVILQVKPTENHE